MNAGADVKKGMEKRRLHLGCGEGISQ